MTAPYTLVTLVTDGGTPVQLVDQTGAPFPTTGTGALVFANGPTLNSPVWAGTLTIDGLTVTGNASVGGTLDVAGAATMGSGTVVGSLSVGATLDVTGLSTLGSVSVTNDIAIGGTVTSGTWNGSVIGPTYGGTGFSSYAVGDLLYADSTTTLAKLPVGTNGQRLTLSGGLPVWADDLSGVTSFSAGTTGLTPSTPTTGAVVLGGTLGIANGGTGQTSASAAFNALSPITTTGDLIIGNGANSATRLGIGTNGYVLTSNGTTASWQAVPADALVVGSTAISGGTTGRVLYDNGGTLGEYTTTGTAGSVVLSTSPQFVTGIGVGVAANSTARIATGGSISGATSMYNVLAQGTIQSGVTGAYYGFWSQPSTAASSFTLNSIVHYGAQFTSAGAGSTVTNQFGFYVGSGALTGATSNYAFYGGLASGSGAYNLYMAGTAANYLGGATTFNAAITYGGVTLANSVTGTGSMVLSAGPTFTGFTSTANLQSIVADGTYGFYVKNATNWLRFSGYVSGASFIEAVNNTQSAWTPLTIGGSVVNLNVSGANIIALDGSSVVFNVAATSVSGLTLYSATSIPAGGTTGTGYKFSSTANFGVFFGSGAPTLSAAQGSLYVRSDGAPYYNNNGTTGWTEIGAGVTAASNTSTAADLYPVFIGSPTGVTTTIYTGSTNLLYRPDTGEFKAKVPVANNGIFVNSQTVATDYTIASGFSGMSAGPVTVASGKTVTISSGSKWVVL